MQRRAPSALTISYLSPSFILSLYHPYYVALRLSPLSLHAASPHVHCTPHLTFFVTRRISRCSLHPPLSPSLLPTSPCSLHTSSPLVGCTPHPLVRYALRLPLVRYALRLPLVRYALRLPLVRWTPGMQTNKLK